MSDVRSFDKVVHAAADSPAVNSAATASLQALLDNAHHLGHSSGVASAALVEVAKAARYPAAWTASFAGKWRAHRAWADLATLELLR